MANVASKAYEIWETTTGGDIWVIVTDSKGNEKHERVGGRKGAKLRITPEDREWNQEKCADTAFDVFTNGHLALVKAAAPEQEAALRAASSAAMPDEELIKIYAKRGKAFEKAVEALPTEITVRRLFDLGPKVEASVVQMDFLNEFIEQRYVVGGTQSAFEELSQIRRI